MSPDRRAVLDMVDDVNLRLERIQALLDGIGALAQDLGSRDPILVLASMAQRERGRVDELVNSWWEASRDTTETVEHCYPKHRTDKFDCQSERDGT